MKIKTGELKDKALDSALVDSIVALVSLDRAGVLVPHGIGGHARSLLESAAIRLSQPDRVAELEQLRQRVAELEKERDAALETIKQQHRIHVELVEEKEVAEAKADEEHKHSCKMAYQRDIANVEIATLKSALKVARDALNDCEGALDECRDYPITYDTILETLAKINEVMKP